MTIGGEHVPADLSQFAWTGRHMAKRPIITMRVEMHEAVSVTHVIIRWVLITAIRRSVTQMDALMKTKEEQ
jgi:hypothetical protein